MSGLQGVFLTFEPTAKGANHLTRIRFNRQHYSREQAQLWWQEHRLEIAHHYQLITDGSSAASTSDISASPRCLRSTTFAHWHVGHAKCTAKSSSASTAWPTSNHRQWLLCCIYLRHLHLPQVDSMQHFHSLSWQSASSSTPWLTLRAAFGEDGH